MAQNEQKQLDWHQRWQLLITESNIGDATSARGTRVQRLEVEKGQISAQVKDRELGVYAIDIRWPPLNDREWGLVIETIVAHSSIAVQLAAGEVSTDVEALFHEAGYDLLPDVLEDWRIDYTAVEQKQNGNEHQENADASSTTLTSTTLESNDYNTLLSAVYQMLGTAFHDDPWLILRLRGRDRQQLIDGLRGQHTEGQGSEGVAMQAAAVPSAFDDASWGAGPAPPMLPESTFFYADRNANTPHDEYLNGGGAALEDAIDTYWGVGKRLRSAQHHIAPPLVDQVLLRRLGPPPFAKDGDATYAKLSEIYQSITRQAMRLAYADEGDV